MNCHFHFLCYIIRVYFLIRNLHVIFSHTRLCMVYARIKPKLSCWHFHFTEKIELSNLNLRYPLNRYVLHSSGEQSNNKRYLSVHIYKTLFKVYLQSLYYYSILPFYLIVLQGLGFSSRWKVWKIYLSTCSVFVTNFNPFIYSWMHIIIKS